MEFQVLKLPLSSLPLPNAHAPLPSDRPPDQPSGHYDGQQCEAPPQRGRLDPVCQRGASLRPQHGGPGQEQARSHVHVAEGKAGASGDPGAETTALRWSFALLAVVVAGRLVWGAVGG